MDVSIHVANLEDRGDLGKLFQNGAMERAVAAPRPGKEEDVRSPDERFQQLRLVVGEFDVGPILVPSRLVAGIAVFGKEVGIGEAGREGGVWNHASVLLVRTVEQMNR